MFWETKTWNREKVSWKKLTEMLICFSSWSPNVRKRTSSVLASCSSPSSRRNQTITSKLATSSSRSTCADATSCSSTTTLHQSSKNVSMSGLRQHKAETSNTQSITTSTSNVQSRTLGSLSFHECLRAFVHGWTRCAGWPGLFRCDRGTRNRGASSSILTKNGVTIRLAGLEAPEHVGRVE